MGTTAASMYMSVSTALLLLAAAQTGTFTCNSTTSCQSLVDYITPNTTTLSSIQTLFGIRNHRTLLGANNLDPSTSHTTSVPEDTRIRIPFHCSCSNGTGRSHRRPIYTVQPGDGLSHIAEDVFGRLVTYQQIAEANNITNVNLIQLGQELYIPIPCSCDDVDGLKVVHYGHMVEPGTSLKIIAATFGTTESTLMRLNGISDAANLSANAVLDVPLKPCSSSIRNDSLDSGLLVPNGTYVYTANNCVRCKCDAASNNYILQCVATQVNESRSATCPSINCTASSKTLSLGEELLSSSANDCNQTCAYTGYTNQTILTALAPEATCTASPDGGNTPSSGTRMIRSSHFVIKFLVTTFAALCLQSPALTNSSYLDHFVAQSCSCTMLLISGLVI